VVVDRPPDPEVPEKAKRRRFTAQYKLWVLKQAEACTEPGQVGALLRREGLYSSHLVAWRRARDAGALQELGKKRGQQGVHPLVRENTKLQRQNERLRRQLEQAHRIIEVQGKVSELLGIPLDPASDDPESGS
jgi:transposase-like protein